MKSNASPSNRISIRRKTRWPMLTPSPSRRSRRSSRARGIPEETLANVVRLIQEHFQTDVCSIYLIKPDRANLVLAATVGLRPESVGKVSMKLSEGLTGLAAEQLRPIVVEEATQHPRFKYFPESGEDSYHTFVGVPLLDQGVIQGVLVVQNREPRSFSREETTMLVVAANQVAPTVSEARTLEQFIAPAYERIWALARNLWWSWDPGAESLFRDLDPLRWEQLDHNPIALLGEISMDDFDARSRRHVSYSTLNYAYRRLQEYLASDRTWGAANAGVLRSRPVAYFSAEFGLHESLPIYSGGLGVLGRRPLQECQRSRRPARRGRPLLRPGLFPPAPQRGGLAGGGLSRSRRRQAADGAGPRQRPTPDHHFARNAQRQAVRPRVASHRGPQPACTCSTPTSREMHRRTAASPRGSTAATSGRASGRSCCWAWAACRRCGPWESFPACCISTKGTARSPAWK